MGRCLHSGPVPILEIDIGVVGIIGATTIEAIVIAKGIEKENGRRKEKGRGKETETERRYIRYSASN